MKHIGILTLILAFTSCSKTTDVIRIKREKKDLPIEFIWQSSNKSDVIIKRHQRYEIKNTSKTTRILSSSALQIEDYGIENGLNITPDLKDTFYKKSVFFCQVPGKSSRSFLVKPYVFFSLENMKTHFLEEEPDSVYYTSSKDTVKIYRFQSIEQVPEDFKVITEKVFKRDSIQFTFIDETLPFYIKKESNNISKITVPLIFHKTPRLVIKN